MSAGYPATELFFVIGADAFADIGAWKDYPHDSRRARISSSSRARAVRSPGCRRRLPLLASRMIDAPLDELTDIGPSIILIDAETADVSSTAIRRRRAENLSIAGMVDPRVQQHIEQHGLYTSMTPGRRRSDEPSASSAGRLHGQD